MIRLRKIAFAMAIVLSVCASAAAELAIEPSQGMIKVGPFTQFIADPDGKLSVTDLLNSPSQAKWTENHQDILNFGYTPVIYWFRFTLSNPSNTHIYRLLAIAYPLLDKIEVYEIRDAEILKKISLGDKLPFASRPIDHQDFLIPIELLPEQKLTYIIRIETDSSMQVPLYLWTEKALLQHQELSLLGQGIYFGIIISMMLYNLFLFISIRDKNYLLYILSVGLTGLVQATLRGYSYQYLWPTSPLIEHYHMPVIVSLSAASVAFFSIFFLDLKQQHRLLYRIVLGMAYALTLNALLSPLTGYPFSVRAGVGLTMLYAIVGLIAGILTWKNGFKPASYFTAAYASLFLGTFIISLSKFGLLPRNIFTENAQEIGSIMEVLLLSFALAHRISVLRQEKEQAQLNATVKLEQKVAERTNELTLALDRLAFINNKLSQQNKEDGLTGLLNRRYFDEVLSLEWRRANRTRSSLALILGDVDLFKQFNDRYGHLIGDDCLRVVGVTLMQSVQRPGDAVFRYGGEEFAILLPDTNLEGACVIAERIRHMMLLQTLDYEGEPLKITMSFGVSAIVPAAPENHKQLLLNADDALFQAKRNGRNCVVAFTNSIV